MAKHTQTEFQDRFTSFGDACMKRAGSSLDSVFNFSLDFTDWTQDHLDVAFYPDYDDNDGLPFVVRLKGGTIIDIPFTWAEMGVTGGVPDYPTAEKRFVNALISILYPGARHSLLVDKAIDLVEESYTGYTVTKPAGVFGPDQWDGMDAFRKMSDYFNDRDIHS
jgi:hypothetical protein